MNMSGVEDKRAGGRRRLVLGVGVLATALSVAGLVTYAVVQVPSLRPLLGHYQLQDPYLESVAYYSEVVLIVTATCLGLLVNILLVVGIHKNKRWYLLHWLIYHALAVTALFMTSILIFVIQDNLYKIIGVAPVAVVVIIMMIWTQVYQLFFDMVPHNEGSGLSTPVPPPPYPPLPAPYMLGQDAQLRLEHREAAAGPGSVTSEYEFYPVDPISRGLAARMQRPQLPLPLHHFHHLEEDTSDSECNNSLRKGRFHRFYDASSLDGEIPADRERDLGAKNIDFKSSGTSVNI